MIDLNNADSQAVQALNRLKEPAGQAFVKLIEVELYFAKQKLVRASDTVIIHRLQGRAEAFEDILTAINESSQIDNRAHAQKKKSRP